MEALSFTLSGDTAMFRKPDVNKTTYFTFMNIHKPALLGIFGALIGLNGYSDCLENNKEYPEYYSQFMDLSIAIIPIFQPKQFSFSTTIQTYTNTTGLASKEQGGTLIIKEQWLKKPCWKIIVQNDDSDAFKLLKQALIQQESHFEPYLGKNNHPAVFSEVVVSPIKEINKDEYVVLQSLSFSENILDINGFTGRSTPFMYKEFLPIALNPIICSYIEKELFLTNQKVKMSCPIYQLDDLFFTLI